MASTSCARGAASGACTSRSAIFAFVDTRIGETEHAAVDTVGRFFPLKIPGDKHRRKSEDGNAKAGAFERPAPQDVLARKQRAISRRICVDMGVRLRCDGVRVNEARSCARVDVAPARHSRKKTTGGRVMATKTISLCEFDKHAKEYLHELIHECLLENGIKPGSFSYSIEVDYEQGEE